MVACRSVLGGVVSPDDGQSAQAGQRGRREMTLLDWLDVLARFNVRENHVLNVTVVHGEAVFAGRVST